MESLTSLVSLVWAGWRDAMGLRLNVTEMIADPQGTTAAVLVAITACVSTLLGRSVVLAVNRVRRGGMLLGMVLSFATVVLTYALIGLLVWAAGSWLLHGVADARHVAWAVLWAASPLVLGFATVIPLFGPAIDRGLTVWSVLVLWSIVDDIYDTSALVSGAVALGAWLLTWLLRTLYAPQLARVRDWLWRRVTGRPLYDSSRYILDQAAIDGSAAALVWHTARPAELPSDGARPAEEDSDGR